MEGFDVGDGDREVAEAPHRKHDGAGIRKSEIGEDPEVVGGVEDRLTDPGNPHQVEVEVDEVGVRTAVHDGVIASGDGVVARSAEQHVIAAHRIEAEAKHAVRVDHLGAAVQGEEPLGADGVVPPAPIDQSEPPPLMTTSSPSPARIVSLLFVAKATFSRGGVGKRLSQPAPATWISSEALVPFTNAMLDVPVPSLTVQLFRAKTIISDRFGVNAGSGGHSFSNSCIGILHALPMLGAVGGCKSGLGPLNATGWPAPISHRVRDARSVLPVIAAAAVWWQPGRAARRSPRYVAQRLRSAPLEAGAGRWAARQRPGCRRMGRDHR